MKKPTVSTQANLKSGFAECAAPLTTASGQVELGDRLRRGDEQAGRVSRERRAARIPRSRMDGPLSSSRTVLLPIGFALLLFAMLAFGIPASVDAMPTWLIYAYAGVLCAALVLVGVLSSATALAIVAVVICFEPA